MNAFAIVWIIIMFALAYATVSIADKKGYYSKVGFFFYGLAAPLIAIIHVGILPNSGDSTKRQYSSKALLFNILAVIFSFYCFLFSLYEMYVEILRGALGHSQSVEEMLYNQITVMSVLSALILLVSLLLGRKYSFSLIAYAAFAIKYLFELIRQIIVISKGLSFYFSYKELGGLLIGLSYIVETILFVVAYVGLIYIGNKYGVKNERTDVGKVQPIFVIPGLLALIGLVLTLIVNVVSGYYVYDIFIALWSRFIFVVPTLFFLGLFYYHDIPDEYKFEKNHIEINNRSYDFEFDIRTVIHYKNRFIILLGIPYDSNEINNIYCLDAKAKIKWQSQDIASKYPELKNLLAYEQMGLLEDKIYATDFYGRQYKINAKTGKIEGRSIVK